MRRISLPDSFEARFIVGRSLFLVPVLTFVLFVIWRSGTHLLWLFALKYLLSVGIVV